MLQYRDAAAGLDAELPSQAARHRAPAVSSSASA